MPQIALAAEIEIDSLVREAFEGRDRLQDLEPLGSDFRTGAVAANHGNAHRLFRVHNIPQMQAKTSKRAILPVGTEGHKLPGFSGVVGSV